MPEPYTYRVKEILRTLDGDTVDCCIDLGFGLEATFRFRLAGIDTPERTEPRWAEAKFLTGSWLASAMISHDLTVTTSRRTDATVGIGDGAFGRWLGTFECPSMGRQLVDVLTDEGWASNG